jgi:predicted permease
MRRANLIETLLQDMRYAFRMLLKSPGFTLVTVLTLALGIGANTAIFSIVNGVLLRSLPYRDPDRLVKISFDRPGISLEDAGYSVPELEDLRSRAGVFDDVTVIWPVNANLTGASQPERLELLAVSPNYFAMLGTSPQMGRLLGDQDSAPGFAEAVVISDGLWTRAFGRDPGIIGRGVRLDNDLYTIVGVAPTGFRHPGKTVVNDVDVWTTSGFIADPFPKPVRNARFLPGAIGRLRSGLSLKQAQTMLDALSMQLRSEFPDFYSTQARWSIHIQPLQQSLVGKVRPMLLVLMGAVFLIILIASVNIANLLLARASARQREIAMRLALGATRPRIVRQMLTESIILSLIGGVAGVVAASSTLAAILRFVPAKIPRLTEVGIHWAVLGFALLISVLTGLAFGLAPAIQSVKADVSAAIKEGARGSGYGKSTGRLRDLLTISQLALAVVLMVGAGLLLRTFWTLLQVNPGFNPTHIVTAGIWLPVPNDPSSDPYAKPGVQNNFVLESLRRVAALPGVETSAMTTSLPATDTAFSVVLNVENRTVDASEDPLAKMICVSPDYLNLMQATLVEGRSVNEQDQQDKPQVAVIDQTTARRFWAGQDPLGRRLKLRPGPNAPWLTVVGVIRDIKHDGLDTDGIPHIYTSIYQLPSRQMSLVIRTSLPPSALETQIRRQIQAIDPALPIFSLRSMTDVLDASLGPRRFSAQLVAAFAVLALLLASVGIYGLLAYMVGQRSDEIGIRMALGAKPSDIRRMILGKGTLLAGLGVLIGLVLAALIAPAIAALLYGVNPVDPLVFLVVAALLIVIATLAGYIPARRATSIDPVVALRQS